jgi:hypothetical protein
VIRRIYLFMAVLGAIGLLIAWGVGGRAALAGFFLGSVYSVLSFRFFHRVVESMGTDKPRKASALFLTFRLLLLGGLLYVILKYLETSLPAALWGLFLGIAAVFLESLYELFYART